MAKKKKKVPSPGQGSIFDHFQAQGRHGYAREEEEGDDEDASTQILARLEALEAENASLREAAYRPAPQAARTETRDAAPIAPKFDLTGLPDPVSDPEGHRRELEARVSGFVTHQTYATKQEIIQEQRQTSDADALWTQFSSSHPEWAEHEELVGAIAQKLVQKAQTRGWDTQKYVIQEPERFFSDLNKELTAKYGALLAGEEQDDAPPRRTQPAGDFIGGPEEDLDDAERTAGLFGGQESGGKPAPGKKGSADADMIKDLHALQRASGFFALMLALSGALYGLGQVPGLS